MTDEMIRSIEEDLRALDPDGNRRAYEKRQKWNEYQRRYRLGIHKPPIDLEGDEEIKKI